MNTFAQDTAIAERIARAAAQLGGSAYYVGGCVRDRLLGIDTKDIDIEVHGITPAALEEILDGIGKRIEAGVSFGIYKLSGSSVDIAMPRLEHATGRGHRDFAVFVDPYIGTYKAAKRRDFTCNAMMRNILTGELIDHFNGMKDLNDGILRHIDPDSFIEDPLRVLRAAQFSARFGFTLAPETKALCASTDLTALSKERIMGELEKALLKSERPSVFFEILRELDHLSVWFPELEQLIGVKQNPHFHAEGDVWTHTMMVIDEAAKRRGSVKNPLGFMLSAVTHDFGKAVCTTEDNGRIRSLFHETEGLPLVDAFITRLTSQRSIKSYVHNMTELHMAPIMYAKDNSSRKSTNKLFDRSCEPYDLIQLSLSDDAGRITEDKATDTEAFLIDRLEYYTETMSRPYVMGRDLIKAGIKPSENFSDILAYAHKLRLAGVEKRSALTQTLAYASRFR